MGNLCADTTSKPKFIKQTRHSIAATKQYQKDSSLVFEIQTWKGQILPDLRNFFNIDTKQFVLNKQGQLIYSEKFNTIQFIPKLTKAQKDSNDTIDSAQNSSRPNLTINIQKQAEGYYLSYANDFIYELTKEPRVIEEGMKFLLGGTQYKLLKFINDSAYKETQLKSVSHFADQNQDVKTSQYLKSFKNIPSNIHSEQEMPICRICMSEQISSENPLIHPCDCIGSVKYFHLKCWTQWAFTSEQTSQNIYIGNVKRQSCQICKKSLINSPIYRQTVAALLSSVHKIKTPFVVLEGLKSLPNYPYYRSAQLNYVVLSFADKKMYSIGRGANVDVRLSIDTSISRKNSRLSMKNGKIYIQDLQSKHGTYTKTDRPSLINNNSSKSFLYKNHLISVKIQ